MSGRLSAKKLDVIAIAVSGEPVVARRTFPHPHAYSQVGQSVTEAAVRSLVSDGYMRGIPQDHNWDVIHFVATQKGRDAVTDSETVASSTK